MWTVISGILGILGFIISLINLIHYLMSNRIFLEIKIIEYAIREYNGGNKRIVIHYQMNNRSHLPITITDMQIIFDDKKFVEDFNTHEILSYRRIFKDINEYIPTYNEHLPINLPELSSHAGYLVFVVPEDIAEEVCKDLIFQIRTNRHKEVQKKFQLNGLVTIRRIPPKQ